jgi:D-galactarolactone cycloisomerase
MEQPCRRRADTMRIEQADIYVLKVAKHYRIGGHELTPDRLAGTDYYFEPQWKQAYSRLTEACLVRLVTSNGIAGWGEAHAPLVPETPASLVARLLGPAVIGQPALASEPVYERLYHTLLARGHNAGFLLDAIGAIDTALWDIRGQAWSAPICELLGGPFRETLPAYLSGLRRTDAAERLALAREAVEGGLAGVKVFLGQPTAESLEELRAVRTAIGRHALLAADCIHGADWGGALRIGLVLDELEATFLEAPLGAEDIEGHRDLGTRIRTRLAGGEHLRSVQQFLPWLQSRAIRIAQPDVVRAGVTAVRRIAAATHALHLPVALHVGVCTGVGVAATWQVAASLPNFLVQEHQEDMFETANRFLQTPLAADRGRLVVPRGPGLGVRVSEDEVLRHTVEHWTVTVDGPRLNARSSP